VAKRLPRICVIATASGALGLIVATGNVGGALGGCCAGSRPKLRKHNESRITLRINKPRLSILHNVKRVSALAAIQDRKTVS
jgi:hypothetical protein